MKKTILRFTIFCFGLASSFSQICATSNTQVLLPDQPITPGGSIVEPAVSHLPVSNGKNDIVFIDSTSGFLQSSSVIGNSESIIYPESFKDAPLSPTSQIIQIPQGWSGISSYLLPLTPNIEQLFQPILNNLIILQNETGFYWPGQNINTLGTWNTFNGYKIKATNTVELTITGIAESSHTLQLDAGWNLIPVLFASNINVVSLFEGTSVVVVKEIAGQSLYWPLYGINTLGVIEPGKAYFALMGSSTSITFPVTNPTAPPPPPSHHTITPTYTGNCSPPLFQNGVLSDIINTPVTHLIAICRDLLQDTEIAEDSYMAAFDSQNHCFGIASFKYGNTALTIFGDDPTTEEKDGFFDGERIFFSVLAQDLSPETQLNVEFDKRLPQHDGLFAENGLSAFSKISLQKEVLLPNENQISIFPNPAGEKLFIQSESWQNTTFVITNLQGQLIHQGAITHKITEVDVSSFAPGIFLINVTGLNKQYQKQFVKH